ncbi:lactonase family protein [Streptacidiphilus jiangxiensis]|uniref:6-phosphogluconolactonase, cycloisomerase 2 family n=1 Tax=Streptacidiphilus jiangxiensis TaxID=235985 RepID=A0A1H7N7T0_STRJI|nr:beta-propeller fold lactonase family protein [Streptacidiphilus jiangxiensis]SEL19666.1 6-phosphogluconolactonase, cycloisomerase 2 family [Streptacidiphilus jiangxiensis]
MNTAQLLVTGCYDKEMDGRGTGLTSYRRDPGDGSLTPLDTLALPSPSYVVRHPTQPLLYTANEAGEVGSVSVVAVAADGSLREVERLSSQGGWPCHLAVGEGGRRLAVANYRTGTALFLDLDEAGRPVGGARLWAGDAGALGPRADRQDGPHAHMVVPGPDGLWTVVDLGTDQLRSGRADADGPEAVTALPAGTGPRQLVRAADGMAYVVGELDSRLHVLREAEPGRFRWLGAVPATGEPERTAGNLPAHLTVSADGSLLLLSNRVTDTVALFRTRPDGLPRPVGEVPSGGAWPRHMELVGDHLHVCDERTDTLAVFTLDVANATLTLRHRYATGSPTCALAIG